MKDVLLRVAIATGDAIQTAKVGLVRNGADNARWRAALKERCLLGIRKGLETSLAADVGLRVIEVPYSTSTVGKGGGRNEMSCSTWRTGARTLTVLADVLDGSWNAACDVPWSASTMLAMTSIEERPTPAEELVLADFKCALIVPLVTTEEGGFFYGVEGEPPRHRAAGATTDSILHPTDAEDVRQTRFILDLFTTQTYETLSISIDAVKPLIHDWADIGRFYGAGMELMALLGKPGVTPGFGGYVAANQKADNLIPTKMLLEGAGVLVTDWWGAPIDRMRIMDRTYVAIAANRPLHDHMVGHLKRTVRLP